MSESQQSAPVVYDNERNPPFWPLLQWLHSPLSLTRFYGACCYNGVRYEIDELTEDLCRQDVMQQRRAAYTPADLATIRAKHEA